MHVRRLRLLVGSFVVCAGMHSVALADTLVYQPNDKDLDDLDHHYVYTWKITNIAASIPAGHVVDSAYLFFDNIRNWNNDENRLFMHLLDTSLAPAAQKLSGSTVSIGNESLAGDEAKHYAYRAQDAANSVTGNIKDHFAVVPGGIDPLNYFSVANSLVSDGTANTPLGEHYATTIAGREQGWAEGDHGDLTHSFTTTPEDYQYDFNAAQILKLREYIANGNDIAFALDPDCHFFNDGVRFVMTTRPADVAEPASLALLGLAAAGACARRRRAHRVLATLRMR